MVMPFDFGAPGAPQQIQAAPQMSLGDAIGSQQQPIQPPTTPEHAAELEKGWREYLASPEVQAGLLQFSVNILQPVGPGQTQLGHLGRAVGGGAEAIGRVQAQGRADTQQTEENRQAQAQIEDAQRRTDILGEQVGATREATAVRERTSAAEIASREGVARADREAAKDRLDKELKLKREEIDSLERRLRTRLAADATLAEMEKEDALWEAVIKAASTDVDLSVYDLTDPQQKAEYDAAVQAIEQRAQQLYVKFASLRRRLQDPDGTTPDSSLDAAFTRAASPEEARATLLGAGISPERVEAAAQRYKQQAALAEADAAQKAESAPAGGGEGTTPTTGVTKIPQEEDAALAEIDAKLTRYGQRFGVGDSERTQLSNEILAGLPDSIDRLPTYMFNRMYQDQRLQEILYGKYGQPAVDNRRNQMFNAPGA